MIKIIIVCGLCWGPLTLGNYQISSVRRFCCARAMYERPRTCMFLNIGKVPSNMIMFNLHGAQIYRSM